MAREGGLGKKREPCLNVALYGINDQMGGGILSPPSEGRIGRGINYLISVRLI